MHTLYAKIMPQMDQFPLKNESPLSGPLAPRDNWQNKTPCGRPGTLLCREESGSLVDGWMEGGIHSVIFDATELPSRLYFCRFDAGVFKQTMRLMLLK
jgi:hypothetical protein